jgi:hypothetical protein
MGKNRKKATLKLFFVQKQFIETPFVNRLLYYERIKFQIVIVAE